MRGPQSTIFWRSGTELTQTARWGHLKVHPDVQEGLWGRGRLAGGHSLTPLPCARGAWEGRGLWERRLGVSPAAAPVGLLAPRLPPTRADQACTEGLEYFQVAARAWPRQRGERKSVLGSMWEPDQGQRQHGRVSDSIFHRPVYADTYSYPS